MISGWDVLYKTPYSCMESMEGALRIARKVWPKLVYEDADTGELLKNVGAKAEVMFYKNKKCREWWSMDGKTTESENTMIHVIVSTVRKFDPLTFSFVESNKLTLVVDDPLHEDMKRIIRSFDKLFTRQPYDA